MLVKRVIGNNAVLATDDEGHEVVALGRGLGHSRRPGDPLGQEQIEQVFVPGGGAAYGEQLAEFLANTPLICVRTAAKIADLAHDRLGLRVTQSLILPLADHLTFALQRQRDGIVIQFPLLWEVGQLYPQELEVGREAVRLANSAMELELAPDEAVAFAMHLVNAQFATPGMSHAIRMTETITQAFGVVERTFAITIDQHSMNAARFVTHLRYLYTRVTSGAQINDPRPTFVEAIANAHPDAMACAVKVQYLIEMGLSAQLTPDEVAYLALHVARLVWDVRGST
jgi:beta-glucoside operon transcriptional antiterminator